MFYVTTYEYKLGISGSLSKNIYDICECKAIILFVCSIFLEKPVR